MTGPRPVIRDRNEELPGLVYPVMSASELDATPPLTPESPSALGAMINGVSKGITEGVKGAGQAFTRLNEVKGDLADGAILGGKMAVPVLKYAGDKAQKDALFALLSATGHPVLQAVANNLNSRDMQILSSLQDAESEAKRIAEEIKRIVESNAQKD